MSIWEAPDAVLDGSKDGDMLMINARSKKISYRNPGATVVNPDNSEAEVTVDLSDTTKYPPGSLVLVQDVYGAEDNNITVTPRGSFIGIDGQAAAGTPGTIDVDDDFRLFLITESNTLVQSGAGGVDNKVSVPASSAAGDILYHDGTSYVRLPKGTAGQVLTMNAGATAPEWATP